MTIDQLEDWLPRLAAISPDQRTALPGVTPERTYQIVGGGLVIDEIMKALDVKEVEICHGVAGRGVFCAARPVWPHEPWFLAVPRLPASSVPPTGSSPCAAW